MKPPLPMGPPDVAELHDLIDQWAEFTGDLERKDYTFDLDVDAATALTTAGALEAAPKNLLARKK